MYKQIIIENKEWPYLIYDDGRVYSLKTNKFLSPDYSSGYARVLLCYNKHERKRVPVHMLVGKAFIENINNLPVVHHKDGNRLNNNVSNLEWISRSDNVKKENRHAHEKLTQSFSEKELLTEEWRPFRDGRYWVSSLGRLKNIDTGKYIEGHIEPHLLYIRDNIYFRNGVKTSIARQRIVWESFHPDENLLVINHKDGIRWNNRLSNLENVTYSENNIKAYTETQTRRTHKCKGVNLSTGIETLFFSIADAARFAGCNESNIRMALRTSTHRSHGYYWVSLTDQEYSQLLKSSETTESIIQEKDLNE